MKRALIVATALGFLLPGIAEAQTDQSVKPVTGTPSGPPGKPGPSTGVPGTPNGPRPTPPGQPNRPPPTRPPPPKPVPPKPAPPKPMPPKPTPPRPMPPKPVPPRPMPPRPMPPRPVPPPQAGRPGYRPPTYVQPLPPRGNQYWHRGQYYGRIPGPAYAYPPGWRYRPWQIGQRLPPPLLAPNYYYQGWAPLGLQAPLPGYAWVRFGPDLLLVNLGTNEVEDVIYGVFL